jgi:hypothetical protein
MSDMNEARRQVLQQVWNKKMNVTDQIRFQVQMDASCFVRAQVWRQVMREIERKVWLQGGR